MKLRRVLFLLPLVITSIALAKAGGNRPYAATMREGGPIYARCLPDDLTSSKGTTQIMQVQKEGDQVITTFNWYNRSGILLSWSPTAGKVGVMRLRQDEYLPPDKQIEFSIYLGDQLVRSYTTAELVKLGAVLEHDMAAQEMLALKPDTTNFSPMRATYEVEGVFQVWNTNDYYYRVKLDATHTLNFDIVTGRLCRVEKLEREERMTLIDPDPAK